MRAREREGRLIVVEVGAAPAYRVMALLAGLRNPAGGMVGAGGLLEVREVAGHAIRRRAREFSANMALGAWSRRVRSSKGKPGHGVVIERRIQPARGAVTGRAFLRVTGAHVAGVSGGVVIREMAAYAVRMRSGEPVVGMARGAFQPRVRACERESGELQVIEMSAQPAIHVVACLAVGAIPDRGVFGIVRVVVIRKVAGNTGGGETHKLSGGCAFVARFAGGGGMRAHQRKTVLVLLHVFDGNLPPFHRMAALALAAHLAAMNIGVAVGALISHIGEDHFHVALGAGHRSMHSTQRIRGLAMVEVGHRPDGLPAQAGVALLTGDCQRAMRASRGGAVLRRLATKQVC